MCRWDRAINGQKKKDEGTSPEHYGYFQIADGKAKTRTLSFASFYRPSVRPHSDELTKNANVERNLGQAFSFATNALIEAAILCAHGLALRHLQQHHAEQHKRRRQRAPACHDLLQDDDGDERPE